MKNDFAADWVVASNPNTATDVLDSLAKSRSRKVRLAVAGNSKTSSTTLDFLGGKTSDLDLLLAIGNHPNVSFKMFKELVKSTGRFLNNRMFVIANDPKSIPEMLDFLVKNNKTNSRISCAVANNISTYTDTLKFLANKYQSSEILTTIANNPNTLPEILEFLATSPHENVVKAVANNQHTPVNLRLILEAPFNDDESDDDNEKFLGLQNLDFSPSLEIVNYDKNQEIVRSLSVYDEGFEHWFENLASDSLELFKQGRLPSWWNFRHMNTIDKPVVVNNRTNTSTRFKIPPPPEPLEFNAANIANIKTESKKVSAMLNAIYEQDASPIDLQPDNSAVLNLDDAHLEIVKTLATRPEWDRDELQPIMKGMMIDGVLEHINDAFFDYCDEAFIEGDDPIEINVELYKEIFK